MAHRLHQLAAEVARIPAQVIPAAADAVADVADAEARRATGDGRMSGMGRRGPRLRTVQRIRTTSSGATAEVAGVPAGGWAILNTGARAHTLAPAPGRVLAGPGMRHPVAGRIRHPGSPARGTWRRVVDQAGRIVPDLVADDVARVLR
jgi:hypothetical protein